MGGNDRFNCVKDLYLLCCRDMYQNSGLLPAQLASVSCYAADMAKFYIMHL